MLNYRKSFSKARKRVRDFNFSNKKSDRNTNKTISNKNNYVELDLKKKNNLKKNHNYSKFPEDFVITVIGPGCEEEKLFFFPDNEIVTMDLYSRDQYSIGSWSFETDTIRILINRIMGKVPYGKELIPPGNEGMETCVAWPYEDYYNYNYEHSNNYYITQDDLKTGSLYRLDSLSFASDFRKEKLNFLSDGDFLFASFELLDSVFLSKYSKKELRLIRNEIFARYGYIFKSEDLKTYFNAKDWYVPKRVNVDEMLTEREKKNIELILYLENK